jgi:hypothetical protein
MGAALSRFAEQLKAHRDDPIWFCRNVLGRDPHEGQQRWLTGSVKDENMVVTGNRWGKSEIAAAKRIWKCATRQGWSPEIRRRMAMMHQPYHAINIAMTADQSRLVWFKAHAMLQNPKAAWLVKQIKMTPFPRIEFINGAVFEARSTSNNGERLLGNVYDDINWDEAAYEKRFSYILDNVLRMRVLDRAGTIDYTSTGNGRNEFGLQFLRGLEGKDPDLYCQTGPTWENPYVDHIRLEKTAARMPERMRRQNIGGEIVEGGGTFFPGVDIDAAVDPDLDVRVLEWDEEDQEARAIVYVDGDGNGNGGIEWIAKYPSHQYVDGWDLADKKDWAVGTTWDVTVRPHTMVEFERFRRVGWSNVWSRARVRNAKYRSKTWVDSTGVGDVAMDELVDIGVEGVNFSGRGKKDAILGNLQSLLSCRELRVPPLRVWETEMRWYEREDEDLITDCVMSTAVAGVGMKHGAGELYFAEV